MSPLALALVKLAIAAAPLAAMAKLARIYPGRRMVLLALAPALSTLALVATPAAMWLVVILDVVFAAAVVVDVWSLPARRDFSVHRHTQRIASLQKRHAVTLTVSNHAGRAHRLEVRDGVPHVLQPTPSDFAETLAAGSRLVCEYHLRPSRRGAFDLDAVHLRAISRRRLWSRLLDYPCPSTIHVYPDMKQLGEYALLARTNRLSLMGVRRTRRIGMDHDFERLRDYTPDDNYKHIDWRATARRRKLTVKDFQASQSQRIIFLVDCGRMVTNEAAGLSLLDHALNAILMLGYIALGQGDSVGLLAFSDEIHGYVPPRGGMAQMNRLLHAAFDRFPRLVESRYDQAFRYLASHGRKRSLVVLVTNVIDEVNSNQIDRYLGNLVGRHLPLAVFLRDRRIFEAVEVEHPQGSLLYRAAAAAEILSWRHQVLTDLQSKGVLALDVFPEEMTAPLINRYLEIKARHLL
ncbi:MAG: DUF58 domain-containing protein [Rhodopirellula sp.]|nr:DUF58 domain-containing protein [Rhodopirellula sp.]